MTAAGRFAMGVVLWECLTGVRLYRATTSEAELVAAVAACAIERPTLIEGSIPAALEAVVFHHHDAQLGEPHPFPASLEGHDTGCASLPRDTRRGKPQLA